MLSVCPVSGHRYVFTEWENEYIYESDCSFAIYSPRSLDPLSPLEEEFSKSTAVSATIYEDISIYFNFCYLVMTRGHRAWCAGWFYVNLKQVRVHLEEGAPIEKMPPQDQALGKPAVPFLD